ncbi:MULTISPECIES: hypothetical protein [Aneurinibacillus]|uniref:Sporulation related domain-containing protein n=1 Tax=Aneurinibacillus thermoaerophilus TaxID=143495 RepID=A0A1G7ZS74_ANETH|nr:MULTISPECIES: hypothetical protein [Aneurinibacillus]AMA72120.1 hypothetical protein ACH33_04150 [Aneurinibacillus sp. XH2]MED0676404.1 hypothetical protein [Aneurinibacillus thermoaerophilus]MED0678916.1 hypothetical protein [Aneurinibacillus thermoaerophilus]MED0736453.1 hypothetical protein [Aneurinibacillus thermoaerophilus]MED0755956.1 hypothetical protein [Aneurinibacillus thermoaerophilus]
MKKRPDYTIRIRPREELSRSEVKASAASRPKIKLNCSPVSVIPAKAEEQNEPLSPPVAAAVTESMMNHKEIEEVESIGFRAPITPLFGHKKRSGRSFKPPRNFFQLSAVVGGAVSVGLLFGYVILHTFTTGSTPTVEDMTKPSVALTQKGENGAAGRTSTEIGTQASVQGQSAVPKRKSLTLTLPVMSLYMVQGGVFSTRAGAEQEAAALREKGWPVHMVEEAGKQMLFLGVSALRDDALALAQVYRADKQEVYIKEKSLPAGTITVAVPEELTSSTMEEIKRFGQTQADLFQNVSLLTGEGFKTGKIEQAAIQKMMAKHRELLQQGRSLTTVLAEQQKTLLQSALNEMTTAVTTLQQFSSQPNRTYLWQAEEKILRFIAFYKQWQEAMATPAASSSPF